MARLAPALLGLLLVCSGCHGFFQTPKVTSLTVNPSSATIAKGSTQQFTAVANFDDGSTRNLNSGVTWQSSATNIATINSSTGVATGIAAGQATITATASGVSGTATLTVTNSALQSITISPTSATISVTGGGIGTPTSQQFTATGHFGDGTTPIITNQVTWLSSPAGVVTISSSGVATAVAQGQTSITATSGSIVSNTASVTVNP